MENEPPPFSLPLFFEGLDDVLQHPPELVGGGGTTLDSTAPVRDWGRLPEVRTIHFTLNLTPFSMKRTSDDFLNISFDRCKS